MAADPDHVVIEPVDPTHPHAQHCLAAYFAEIDERFATGFDPTAALPIDLDSLRPPLGTFLVARLHDEPVGCCALKHGGADPPEVKRMWVSSTTRGLGVGRRLLAAVEDLARASGATVLRLDTNATLVEAIALYRSVGYVEIARFNDEVHADHWFEKRL
jgi:GNAT superfamily N-acetyltransferase